jgi:hypothetical protein
MTEEDTEEKTEEVPEAFISDVNRFCGTSDTVFVYFNEIYHDYVKGMDIQENLKTFLERTEFSNFFKVVFLQGKTFKEWIDKAKIQEEKRDKMFDFRDRYSDFTDLTLLLLKNVLGIINPWNTITSEYTFSPNRNTPMIDMKFLFSEKEIFHTKRDIDDVCELAKEAQSKVKDCLVTIKSENIKATVISDIKKATEDIERDAKEILDIIGEVETKIKVEE